MRRRTLLTATTLGAASLALSGCANMMSAEAEGPGNIVEVAQGAGTFNTLVSAVTAADLVETLSGPGPFTLFAPTDDAFAALPAGTVDTLLLPENRDQLVDVLTYHVIPGRIGSTDFPTDRRFRVTTVQGDQLLVDTRGAVTINGENEVITPDIEASNGVIHVIDGVLLP